MSSLIKSESRNDGKIVIVDSIDLHGYRLERGISALTEFLSEIVKRYKRIRNGVWVTVITGSGKHSPHGPVLRQAVESLLTKREMNFWLNPGRGSFTVRADSGFELYAEDPGRLKDTKVILKQSDDLTIDLRISSRKKKIKSIEIVFPERNEHFSLTPSEIAAEDHMLSAAKKESMKETVSIKSLVSRESLHMKEALKKSIEFDRALETEEDVQLKKAIAFSCMNSSDHNYDEPFSDLKTSLIDENKNISKYNFKASAKNREDDDMEAAIRESLLLLNGNNDTILDSKESQIDDNEKISIYDLKVSAENREDDDMESAIRESLLLSKTETYDNKIEFDMETAIKESLLLAEVQKHKEKDDINDVLYAIEEYEKNNSNESC